MYLTSGITLTGGLVVGTASDSTTINNTLLLSGIYGSNAATNNTFVDSSLYNNTLTRVGNVTQGSFTPFNSNYSVNLNGSSNYISLPSSTNYVFGTGNFTIECWVMLGAAPGSAAQVIDFRPASTQGLYPTLYISSDRTIRYYTNSADRITGSALTLNNWYHIAVVRNSSVTTLYVNGTASGSTYADTNLYLQGGIFIGASYAGGASITNYLTGYVSNVRVTRGTALYTATFTPSTTPLTTTSQSATSSQVALLTCQSNRFIDNSTNAATLTANASPVVQTFSPYVLLNSYNPDTITKTYLGSGYFPGSGSSYLSAAFISTFDITASNFTIDAWIYLTASGSQYNIIVCGNSGGTNGYGFRVQTTTGYLFFYYAGGSSVTTTSAVPSNTWVHVAAVRSSTTVTIYINGTSAGSGTVTNGTATTSSLYVGCDNAQGNLFTGYITNLRLIYGTALYTANFTPSSIPAISAYNTTLLLNFTNGSLYDFTTNNEVLTGGSAQLRTTVTKYNPTSMYFSGSGDYLYSASSNVLNLGTADFTIECWAYFLALSTTRLLLDRWASANANSWQLYWRSTGTSIAFLVGASTVLLQDPSATTVTTNQWYHIAVSRSGTTASLFINGTLVNSATDSTSLSSTLPLAVGRQYSTSTLDFNGYIDDIRITKGLARYTATFTPPQGPLPLA